MVRLLGKMYIFRMKNKQTRNIQQYLVEIPMELNKNKYPVSFFTSSKFSIKLNKGSYSIICL